MTRRSLSLRRALPMLLVPALLIVLGGCRIIGGGPQSVNEPAGDNMQRIWDLFVPIFWMSAVIFVIVQGVLIYAVIRFRRRPNAPLPNPIHGNAKLEITWTILPTIVLAVILVPTLTTIADFARKPGPEALQVRVIGHQWWWEFDYPELGIVTADELHIPANRPVDFTLESADVIHSFWAPKLAGKQDVVPGHPNHLHFTALEPGTYRGQCAEFCGVQHANMAFEVVAQSESDFNDWVAAQQQPAANVNLSADAQKGQQVFFSAGCVGCHTIQGVEVDGKRAEGKVGPDLTHFGSRDLIAGHVLTNTPENVAKWVHNPQAVKPGTLMPNLGLSEEQAASLAAYLESLQ